MERLEIYNNNVYYGQDKIMEIKSLDEWKFKDLQADVEESADNTLKAISGELVNNIDQLSNPCDDIIRELKKCLSMGKAKDIKEVLGELLENIEGWSESLDENIYTLQGLLTSLQRIS